MLKEILADLLKVDDILFVIKGGVLLAKSEAILWEFDKRINGLPLERMMVRVTCILIQKP